MDLVLFYRICLIKQNILNDVSTKNGNVSAYSIKGDVSTINGDINGKFT